MARVATPEIEQGLLDIAMHSTAAQVEKLVAAYRRARVDPATPAMDMRRFIRRSDTDSGMVRIEIQLPPEQANLLWEAMSAALDAGRRDSDSAESNTSGSVENDSAESRHHLPEGRDVDPAVLQAEQADALVCVAQAYLQHSPRTLGSGYELVVLTTQDQLEHGPGGDGGCRVPGCGGKHHLQAHHIEAWAEGGKTSASNLVLLCSSHHTLVHEGQL